MLVIRAASAGARVDTILRACRRHDAFLRQEALATKSRQRPLHPILKSHRERDDAGSRGAHPLAPRPGQGSERDVWGGLNRHLDRHFDQGREPHGDASALRPRLRGQPVGARDVLGAAAVARGGSRAPVGVPPGAVGRRAGGFGQRGLVPSSVVSRASVHVRVLVQTAVVTATLYVTGWGPVLAVAYAFMAQENVARSGSKTWRITAGWTVLWL